MDVPDAKPVLRTPRYGLLVPPGAGVTGGFLPVVSTVSVVRRVTVPSGVVTFVSVFVPVSSVQPEKANVIPKTVTSAIEALISFRMIGALSTRISAAGNPA
jgi:hypothetical protein